MCKGFIAMLATALTLSACGAAFGADIYFVASAGAGTSEARQTTDPELVARQYRVAEAHPSGITYSLAVGVRQGLVAGEIGGMKLPTYRGYAEGIDPPRSASQSIKGEAYFARMLLYATRDWIVQPYVFGGAAYAIGMNHEQGQCATCGEGYVPDWRSNTRAWVPYYGGGLEVPINERVAVRAEVGQLRGAIDSHWTGRRDYTLGTISVVVSF